jgi:hypothetical protein
MFIQTLCCASRIVVLQCTGVLQGTMQAYHGVIKEFSQDDKVCAQRLVQRLVQRLLNVFSTSLHCSIRARTCYERSIRRSLHAEAAAAATAAAQAHTIIQHSA